MNSKKEQTETREELKKAPASSFAAPSSKVSSSTPKPPQTQERVLDYGKMNDPRLYRQPGTVTQMTSAFGKSETNYATHLQGLHMCYKAGCQSQPQQASQPLAKAWQQPPMTPQQQREYQKIKTALVNPNTSLETMNQLTDPNHPLFPYLTPDEHKLAYSHWYNINRNAADDAIKGQSKQAYTAHNESRYQKLNG